MADTDFRLAMRQSESSGNSGILTDIGGGRQVAGAYQFSEPRLKDYKKATGERFNQEDFLSDMDLQNRVMDWHEQDIVNYAMDNGLDQYIGQEVGGVPVDISSIMAMAHLGGRKGMRDFLQTGGEYDPVDKFKTKISDYGKKFSGMNAYGLTPTRPKARPQGLLEMSPRPQMRPQPKPQGLLDVMPTAPTQRMPPRNGGSLI